MLLKFTVLINLNLSSKPIFKDLAISASLNLTMKRMFAPWCSSMSLIQAFLSLFIASKRNSFTLFVHDLIGISVISTVFSSSCSTRPQILNFPESIFSISPSHPLNHGYISSKSPPSMSLRMFATISAGLKLGILVDHPVPIPSAPFTKSIGITGKYHSGSTVSSSSCK